MKISLLTVSQWPRRNFLACQVDHVRDMLVGVVPSNRVEWVVVNASKSHAKEFAAWCAETLVVPDVELRVIEPTGKSRTIGSMRQLGNESCQGNVMVCIDDDDYYFPTRVTHALETLKKNKADLAACTSTLLLDDDFGVIVRLHGMHPQHGVNSTMAYTKKYARSHAYDASKTFAEEASYTRNFTEPMAQLDGNHVYMQISHFQNTFSKKKILLLAMNGQTQVGTVVADQTPDKFLQQHSPRLLEILRGAEDPPSTAVTFYCGLFSIVWDPECQSLGGSEQAVVNLARCFCASGLTVSVYGNFEFRETRVVDGVEYRHADQFRCRGGYDILVLWRMTGMMLLKSPNLRARRLVVDLHDHIPQTYQMLFEHRDRVHFVMCKSNFQVHLLKSQLPGPLPTTLGTAIIPNGVRTKLFEKVTGVIRNPKHLVYASCYTRGLEPLLKHTWPILYRLDPEAVLHVCYGLETLTDTVFRDKMARLLDQPGVVHHGRLDVMGVAKLKASCGFHLYYTSTAAEIDCISIRESLVVGCLPILSNVNVFGERPGIHIKDVGFESKGYVQLAAVIARDVFSKDLEEVRETLRTSPLVVDWETTAAKWLELIQK